MYYMDLNTTGDQINQRIDIQQIGTNFLNFFFTNSTQNIQNLISSGIIKEHTRIKYQNKEFKGDELVALLVQLNSTINFIIEENTIMDSGGRRADIMVVGKAQSKIEHNKYYRFTQYFTIANNKENWFVHNSLLSILDY